MRFTSFDSRRNDEIFLRHRFKRQKQETRMPPIRASALKVFFRRFNRLVIALSLSAFFSGPATAQPLPLFRIANGTSGETPAVLWVGVDRGFYRRQGVNVEVIFMRTGPLAMSALAAGDIQMVFTSSNNVLNAAAGGLDVAVFCTIVGHPEGDFMARPEIKKAEDLKGKQVAIQSIGGGGWANNMLALDYLNLDPDRDQIHFIVLGDQPSRIQAMETGRAQASWMGSTFSAPLKKKGYTVLVDMAHAPISYLGTSLVARKNAARRDPKLYEAVLKGTIDALRFFMKPENKPAVLQTMARTLRLNRIEDAETGYQALQAVYTNDMRPKPEGVKKIYSILAKSNPKLLKLQPEDIIDDSLIRKIQDGGY
jgi:ABC-type nitrate/sulfonate/bicarbonate transport system substrate-binding protein